MHLTSMNSITDSNNPQLHSINMQMLQSGPTAGAEAYPSLNSHGAQSSLLPVTAGNPQQFSEEENDIIV